MVFASLTRASQGARNSWLCRLEWDRLFRVARGFDETKDSADRPQFRHFPVVNEEASDVTRDQLVNQPGGFASAFGANPFAELPASVDQPGGESFVRPITENLRIGEKRGHRASVLKGLDASCGSGLWLAAADRDAVIATP